MRKAERLSAMALAAAMIAVATAPPAAAAEPSDYTVRQLLEPCVEGDNDSRWGAAAEAECEQYILGFTDALIVLGAGKAGNVCLPARNRADEVRWAFMRWVHQNLEKRDWPAVNGLMATVKSAFKCK